MNKTTKITAATVAYGLACIYAIVRHARSHVKDNKKLVEESTKCVEETYEKVKEEIRLA